MAPQNLFAACRPDGALQAKRVPLHPQVQNQVAEIFDEQERRFRDGCTSEVPFDGRWRPDEDELLTIPLPDEASMFVEALAANAISIDPLNTSAFASEVIKALFSGQPRDGGTTILVQPFTAQQLLERKFAFFQQQNAFQRLTEPAFTMASDLACIIEDGLIKFKSQQKLRAIINLVEIYRAATDSEVETFATHPNLQVEDVEAFVAKTNQTSRKLIHAVLEDGVLDHYQPTVIQQSASATGLDVALQAGKVAMPDDPAGIKALLQFLNESRYNGPLSGQAFVTNSQRRA